MSKIKIAPSLLACDFMNIAAEVKRAEDSGCDMLHLDVMDGVYVPNISFGFPIISGIRKITSLPLDVHMMTAAPQKYIDELKKCGANSVTIHNDVMTVSETVETLKYIHSLGMKAAASLKPARNAEEAFELIEYCDMILVMTVEPGFGGQKFMENMLPKIRQIRDYADRYKPQLDIQVDGGIGDNSIPLAAASGANSFVVGTASFRAPDMKAAVGSLREKAESYYKD